jgi:small basic protein (TIGR04137 family)
MSMHPSLKTGDELAARKSVLSRDERIKQMMSKRQWDDESKVLGLPKIKVVKVKAGGKKQRKEEEETKKK